MKTKKDITTSIRLCASTFIHVCVHDAAQWYMLVEEIDAALFIMYGVRKMPERGR